MGNNEAVPSKERPSSLFIPLESTAPLSPSFAPAPPRLTFHAFELIHVAVEPAQRHAGPQPPERFKHKSNLLAGGEKDDDFGAQVRLDERPQHVKLGLRRGKRGGGGDSSRQLALG